MPNRDMGNSWVGAFNKLFPLITNALENQPIPTSSEPAPANPAYFSGGRFISLVQEFNSAIPHYKKFIELRQRAGLGESRRVYFYDILEEQNPEIRVRIIDKICSEIETHYPSECKEIRGLLIGLHTVTAAEVGKDFWNADRLNGLIQSIDQAISIKDYERAVTLCYTCIEGLFQGFIRSKIPDKADLNEIVKMSGKIRTYLKSLNLYPDDVCTSVITITKLINEARNKFSESHFIELSVRELSIYVRDLTNAVSKLVLSQAD